MKVRYIFSVMGFFCLFNLMVLRNNINVAIVAMVNSTATDTEEVLEANITMETPGECPARSSSIMSNTSSQIVQGGELDWNSVQQGLLLGCYYYGYVFSNIPGAWLSYRYGFKVVMGISHLVGGILTLLIPLVSWTSFELLVALRITIGIFQGSIAGSMPGAVSSWSPPLERSTIYSICYAGSSFGIVTVFPVSGLIADYLGWEAVFYVTGGFVLLFTMLWFYLIYDSPRTHPRISEEEKTFILESFGEVSGQDSDKKKYSAPPVPWKSILSSSCVWAIIIAHFATDWGNYTLLTMLPKYMNSILKFDISASGALSSVPYICQVFITLLGGRITDFLLKKGVVKVIGMRKINTALGLCLPAFFGVLAGYVGCNSGLAMLFFSISVGLIGLIISGCRANPVDIAGKFSGIVYSISNTVANMAGFLAPQVAGILLASGNTLETWQTVFWISAAVYVVGAITFVALGKGNDQSWAKKKIDSEHALL